MNPNWAATAPATNTPEWDDLMASLGLTPSNRLPAPRPEPLPIRHGTPYGAQVHRQRSEIVCDDCRDAERQADRNRYARRQAAKKEAA